MKLVHLLSAAALTFTLTACNSEPSDSDISQAIQKQFDEVNAQASKMMSQAGVKNMDVSSKLNSARKVSCSEGDAKEVYDCKVDLDFNAPMVGQRKGIVDMKFIKDQGEWRLIK